MQHPLVFARYLVPVLPLFLLLAAEGLVGEFPRRLPALGASVTALVGVALWWLGPLPAQSYEPNQFTGHLRFQFDYDDAHNPYVHAGRDRAGARVLSRARAARRPDR